MTALVVDKLRIFLVSRAFLVCHKIMLKKLFSLVLLMLYNNTAGMNALTRDSVLAARNPISLSTHCPELNNYDIDVHNTSQVVYNYYKVSSINHAYKTLLNEANNIN